MPEARTPNSDFNRAFGDARKQAAGVAGEVSDAAQDLYGQAVDSASQVADATTRAARKTAGSFEKAIRNTIENQPYTAVIVALALGWLFGRMHRPLWRSGGMRDGIDTRFVALLQQASESTGVTVRSCFVYRVAADNFFSGFRRLQFHAAEQSGRTQVLALNLWPPCRRPSFSRHGQRASQAKKYLKDGTGGRADSLDSAF
jgi:hypothetical protein